jgi:hypothetical protein
MVVHSGNGLHCYWSTGRVIDLADTKTRTVFRSRLESWQGGHHSDPVSNFDRILRIPGTWNYKDAQRRPVVLKRCAEAANNERLIPDTTLTKDLVSGIAI